MEDTNAVLDVVRRAVNESIGPSSDVDTKEPLLQSGLIDSLNLVQIIVAIQSDLGATIEADEINEENFQSIESIAEFVAKKT